MKKNAWILAGISLLCLSGQVPRFETEDKTTLDVQEPVQEEVLMEQEVRESAAKRSMQPKVIVLNPKSAAKKAIEKEMEEYEKYAAD